MGLSLDDFTIFAEGDPNAIIKLSLLSWRHCFHASLTALCPSSSSITPPKRDRARGDVVDHQDLMAGAGEAQRAESHLPHLLHVAQPNPSGDAEERPREWDEERGGHALLHAQEIT